MTKAESALLREILGAPARVFFDHVEACWWCPAAVFLRLNPRWLCDEGRRLLSRAEGP